MNGVSTCSQAVSLSIIVVSGILSMPSPTNGLCHCWDTLAAAKLIMSRLVTAWKFQHSGWNIMIENGCTDVKKLILFIHVYTDSVN